jgi:hypothetical protein
MQEQKTSRPVTIPSDFLKGPPAQPVSVMAVDWAKSPLPKYAGLYAVVLDNVLSASECEELLRLAVESSDWSPALINVGVEVLATDVRFCDRYAL